MPTKPLKLMLHLTSWLAAEIVLNLVGLDTLAAYSEFVFAPKSIVVAPLPIVLTAIVPPSCRWLRGWRSIPSAVAP